MTNTSHTGHPSIAAPPARPAWSGVDLPVDASGGRTSTAVAREILAAAVRGIDPAAAARIDGTDDWRSGYVHAVRAATIATGDSVHDEITVARDGLAAMRRLMVHAGKTDVALQIFDPPFADPGDTLEIPGRGPAVDQLEIPYRGEILRGTALLEQVGRWVEDGIVQPGVADAIARIVAHPRRLRLEGRSIAVIGAAGEMSPFRALASWGADVLAIDVPSGRVQDAVTAIAEHGSGTTAVPIGTSGVPGADLVTEPCELADWIHARAGDNELVLGMYAYADRAMHLRLSAAFDLIRERLTARRRSVAVAGLATPTDAFVVPGRTVARAERAWEGRGWRAVAQLPLRVASGGRLLAPAYRDGEDIADVLVPQQGPNYAVAKRVQRWIATDAAASGHPASFNVAPASWTRSVLKNRVLASAYAGADIFGIEVFAPETARTLMAALLVDDLHRTGDRLTAPGVLFSDLAVHGGLWNRAYEPRSGLGLAAAIGALRRGPARRPSA
ncbi:MAG: hypothetical protein AAGC46_00585 [Solirubrobacteraceae bacterium]|nr:hypothetical protein [Patulibacter sp.]